METVTEEEYLSTLGVVEIWDKDYNYAIIIVEWEKYIETRDMIMYAVFDGLPLPMIMKMINELGILHVYVKEDRRNYIDCNMYEGHERFWRFGK